MRVPLACLGSRTPAVRLGTLRKHYTKPLLQVTAQPGILSLKLSYHDMIKTRSNARNYVQGVPFHQLSDIGLVEFDLDSSAICVGSWDFSRNSWAPGLDGETYQIWVIQTQISLWKKHLVWTLNPTLWPFSFNLTLYAADCPMPL